MLVPVASLKLLRAWPTARPAVLADGFHATLHAITSLLVALPR